MSSKRQDSILTCLKQQGASTREDLEQSLLLLGQGVSKVTRYTVYFEQLRCPAAAHRCRGLFFS